MKVWARSKGSGPHYAMGLAIPPEGCELEVDEAVYQHLGCIEMLEIKAASSGGEPLAPPNKAEESAPAPKEKKKKG